MCSKLVRTSIVLLVLLTGLLLTPDNTKAQIGGNGTIKGSVIDPNGQTVPGAKVVAKNVATGFETARETTDAGLYVISPLPPGEYTVSVSVTGFQTMVQRNVVVDALSTVT